ncbi:MAG: hypothetical protein JNN15_08395 [Blastocatellia bacterium]|nr:hypothetical protein [Blastocatellia bacterium]
MKVDQENLLKLRMSDTLFTAIRSSLDVDLSRAYSNLILYSSFGVVRGKVSRYMTDSLNQTRDATLENSTSRVRIQPDVLELDDCHVEHYSNHLPTAYFKKLYIRIEDIQGFAFEVKDI